MALARFVPGIAENFNRAAPAYDEAAPVQMQVARHLVETMAHPLSEPLQILDIGSGTGFAAAAAARRWPQAKITALDHAAAMLAQAQNKLPGLQVVEADAATIEYAPVYDLIFSSMMLHWLPEPLATLRRWRRWLRPQGRLYAALPVKGSFREWQELCQARHVEDGLWPLPMSDFADGLAARRETQTLLSTYSSAHGFLRRLKAIGAGHARTGYKPMSVPVMRSLLKTAPTDFTVSHCVLYLEIRPEP